ncbi:Phosphoribosylaminoimidazole-succinocarboxamide synthase [Dorea longicatena]|nr:Phosphoribosylaminoimidazole-succinocarboxamide synthase [Dorea longicatena]
MRDCTIALYKKCAEYALSKGIIIADTKFEFGLDENGNLVIGDEMLTPDSSRFWPADPDNDWTLPQDIVDKTINKYLQAYEMLTGEKLK